MAGMDLCICQLLFVINSLFVFNFKFKKKVLTCDKAGGRVGEASLGGRGCPQAGKGGRGGAGGGGQ